MNGGTNRNVAQRQAVTNPDRRMIARQQLLTGTNTFRCQYIATLTVCIFQQCNVRTTVRVIFKTLYSRRNPVLVATEVDDAVLLLVTTTNVTRGDAAEVVATTGFAFLFQQRSVGLTLVQLFVDYANDETASCGSRLAFNNCHYPPLLIQHCW